MELHSEQIRKLLDERERNEKEIEQLVSRGMIADLAIHEPDKSEIPNPHFHVLCPIRPLNADGTWGMKQHRVYILDEHEDELRMYHAADRKLKPHFKDGKLPITK